MFKTITLKPGKDVPLRRRHPWIFSGALQTLPKDVVDGDLVSVRTADGEILAKGYYQAGSIAVRLLDFSSTEWKSVDELILARIKNAVSFRQSLNLASQNTNAYRLVHGEGDELSGIIIDIFDTVAVIQVHTSGMLKILSSVVTALKETMGESLKAIVSKSHSTVTGGGNSILWGDLPDELIVTENNIRFFISILDGQKTGFFLDQRDNRFYIRSISPGKSVLNLFCYTGGFSTSALCGGAKNVVSVDSSKPAIELLEKNILLNQGPIQFFNHTAVCADVFDYLREDTETYDLIICDPPAFAKHANAIKPAIKGYWRLNREVIKKVAPHGRLATFSCSQLISADAFESAIVSACVDAGRSVRIIHRFEQSACHPVSIFHHEARYLKGLLLQFD